MRIRYARSLPPARIWVLRKAQEDIRRKAVKAVLDGRKQVDVAQIFGITRQAVGNWVRAYRSYGLRFEKGGVKVLKAKPKGRHLEEDRFFPGRQLVGQEPRAPDLSWCQVRRAPDLRTVTVRLVWMYVPQERDAAQAPLSVQTDAPTRTGCPQAWAYARLGRRGLVWARLGGISASL